MLGVEGLVLHTNGLLMGANRLVLDVNKLILNANGLVLGWISIGVVGFFWYITCKMQLF